MLVMVIIINVKARLYYNWEILAKDVPAYHQDSPILYKHYLSSEWAERKRDQLVLHQQGWIFRMVLYVKVAIKS